MRGRKHLHNPAVAGHNHRIKKESPNEGTETCFFCTLLHNSLQLIKKESPNEGTETFSPACFNMLSTVPNKKRIPE